MYLRTFYDTLRNRSAVSKRTRRFGLAVGSSLFSKGITVVLQIGIMPIAIRKLGIELYGVYALLTSFLVLISLSEIRLGPRLIRTLSLCEATNDRRGQKRLISSAFFFNRWLEPCVGSGDKFGGADYSRIMAGQATIPCVCAAHSPLCPAGLCHRCHPTHRHHISENPSWISGASPRQCQWRHWKFIDHDRGAGVLPFSPTIVSLIIYVYAGQVLAAVGNSIWVLKRRPWLVPELHLVGWQSVKGFVHEGVQISANQSVLPWLQREFCQLVLFRLIGPAVAGQFAICLQMTTLIGGAVNLFTIPLYGAISDAVARREIKWIENNMRRLLAFCGAYCVLLMTVFLCCGQQLMSAWLGSRFPAMTRGELTVFIAYCSVLIFRNIHYVAIISIQYVWPVTAISVLEATFIIALIPLVTGPFGLFGVLSVLAAATLISCLSYPVIYRRVLHQAAFSY